MRRHRPPLAFLLHGLLGLNLSLFTLFVCLTGTLAVVADDLEWLYRPEVRAGGPADAGWGRQLAAAQAAYPGYRIDYALAGEEPYLATRFLATDPAGNTRTIHVDPATGRVTGESGWIALPSLLRALHSYLFVPGDWGFFAVTLLGFVLAGLLATGLLTYKRFWRGFLRLPRHGRGARVWWGDLHRLLGLWSLWFVAIMAVTGIWYLGERILYRAGIDLEAPAAALAPVELAALGPGVPARLPLDRLVAVAQAAMPGLVVTRISFPGRPGEALSLRGGGPAWLVRDRATGIDLDPYTGRILARHRAQEMPAGERWAHTADPLHFGDFGGLATKLPWFAFGLALCVSAASGAVIFVGRVRRAAGEAAAARRGFGKALLRLDFMGRWRWPNLLLVVPLPLVACFAYWVPSVQPEPQPRLALARVAVGPWDAAPGGTWPAADESQYWHVAFCAGCYDRLRAAGLGYGTGGAPPADLVPLSGSGRAAGAWLPPPPVQDAPLHLWLRLTGWDGSEHLRAWPLPGAAAGPPAR